MTRDLSSSSTGTGAARAPARERALHTARRGLAALSGLGDRPGAPLLGSARSTWARRLPYVLAILLTTVLMPVAAHNLRESYGMSGAPAGLLGAAQTLPLLMAVVRPLSAWWVIFGSDVLCALLLSASPQTQPWPWPPAAVIGYLALMVPLSQRESRRTLALVWATTGVVGVFLEPLTPRGSDNTWMLLFVLAGVLLLVGLAVRERGDAKRKLREQETISEAERARRTLLEERARIARELHDVVAHHMSVITVQADSAPYRIEGIPPQAREEFAAIATTARESLTEMRRLLGVLRSAEAERDAGPEKAPQPGLDELPRLVEATIRAGVPVELALPEEPVAPEPAVALSAYRIVQEALANVVRHAPRAPTQVSVARSPDGIRLTVVILNGPPPTPSTAWETSGTGHGLVGMRERVRLVEGSLKTVPLPGGGFMVAAQLPLPLPYPIDKDADSS
ncbi:sensor histidine kinase [Streptomyces sp. NPDC059080]|uniref:sensor histidine kinase n=1 Tax=Streptomyces sp. NPDC059080 TaxID=3346718 RepID=UPI0036AE5287